MSSILQNIQGIWQRMSLVQRATLLGILMACGGATLLLVNWAHAPDMAMMHTGLSKEEAANVVEQVRGAGSMSITIDTLVLGPLEVNTYVVRSGGDCWVIDPASLGDDDLLQFLARNNARPSRILLTHGHGDHLSGVVQLKAAFPEAKLCCSAADAPMLMDSSRNLSTLYGVHITAAPADEILTPGDVLRLGNSEWKVLDTSGHTPGGLSFYCALDGVVITGDALFAGSIGRVDIPGGSAAKLLRNIRENLMPLPGDTRVLPGHGEETSISRERTVNPFLQDSRRVTGR